MKSFEFASAGRIIFGSGSAQTLGELGRDLGERALLVCGSGRVAIDQVLNISVLPQSFNHFSIIRILSYH